MRLPFLLTALCGLFVAADVMAEACVINSHDDRVAVKLCQANINIPAELFRTGFCQPQLKDHEVEVEFVDQCPDGAFGVCRNAQVSNMPYRQDIHYYGIASDARFLQPACEQNNQGSWEKN